MEHDTLLLLLLEHVEGSQLRTRWNPGTDVDEAYACAVERGITRPFKSCTYGVGSMAVPIFNRLHARCTACISTLDVNSCPLQLYST
jgi:hypothetical protein